MHVFYFLCPQLLSRYFQITSHAFDPTQTEIVFGQYLSLSLEHSAVAVVKANLLLHDYIYITSLSEALDIFEILGKFLLGYLVLRYGYLKNVSENILTIRRFLWWCLPFAILYVLEMSFIILYKIKFTHIGLRLLLFDFNRVGVLALSLSYAASLVLLFHARPGATIFKAFRYVGMMSLTNYLTHTLIYIFLLHGIGFGLMGKIHLLSTLFIGLLIYVIQVFISKYWLNQFQYGPAEWIWRQLSYWKRFPIRKQITG